MTAALTLMAKDRKGPKIVYQVLFIPATDVSVDTKSYHSTDRFLARAFMKYGWDLYASDEATRDNPYVSPLQASTEELVNAPTARAGHHRGKRSAARRRRSLCTQAQRGWRCGDRHPL